MNATRHFVLLALTLSLVTNLSCSSTDKIDASTPEGAYQLAEEFAKDERYDEAIQRFSDVKNKHPYSRFATMAELRIADLHFERESFIEAQSAYQLFKELHPKHERIDYVTFRLAMSYFNQLPGTIDRDISLAHKAIVHFEEVMNSYPNSQYASEAKKMHRDSLTMLAKKEMYIAAFYVKQDMCDSALRRFEGVLKSYRDLGFDAGALYGAAKCAFKSGDKERGRAHLKNLYSLHPNSDEAGRARHELEKLGSN